MKNEVIRVLLVDDEKLQYILLGKLLSLIGAYRYELEWASQKTEALEKLNSYHYHVCLVDYYLIEETGTQVIQQALGQGCSIPFILLTASEERDVDVEAMEAGACDFLAKERLNEHSLERTIRYAIERKKTETALQGAYQTIKAQQKQIEEALREASRTQASLLPQELPSISQVRLATKFVPCQYVAGDFYNLFPLDDEGKFGIVIADVTGHGPSAAMVSFMVWAIFMNASQSGFSPAVTLNLTNGYLNGQVEDGRYATVFYGIYDSITQRLTYSSAGHPPALVSRPAVNEVISLKSKGFMVGVFSHESVEYTEQEIQLLPGDKVLFYTDGIVEARSTAKVPIWGRSRLETFLKKHVQLPIDALLNQLYQEVEDYTHHKGFEDDVTLVGLEIL